MVFLDVERSKECTFKYTDSEEQTTDNDLTGMLARIALHEYDHMNERSIHIKVSKFKLQRGEGESRKRNQKNNEGTKR